MSLVNPDAKRDPAPATANSPAMETTTTNRDRAPQAPRCRRLKANQALALLLLWLSGWCASADPEQAARDLERLRARIGAIEQALRASLEERDGLTARLAAIEREIGQTGRRIRKTETRIAELTSEIEGLHAREAAERQVLDTHRAALADQLRAAYVMGRQAQLKMWLNQEDPAVLGRALAYHRYLSQARVDRIEAVQVSLQRLDELQAEISRRLEQLTAMKTSLDAEQSARRSALSERQQALAALDQRLATQRSELGTMAQEQARLEGLLQQLRDVFADIPPELSMPEFGSLKGRLRWPINGRLVSSPGQTKSGGLHVAGALLDAAEGSEVRAIAGGRVAYADWLRGFGLLTIVDHGDSYMSLYAFNEALFKDVGDWVASGELLAAVGRSGGRREPALYFELRHHGKPIDPRAWFSTPAP